MKRNAADRVLQQPGNGVPSRHLRLSFFLGGGFGIVGNGVDLVRFHSSTVNPWSEGIRSPLPAARPTARRFVQRFSATSGGDQTSGGTGCCSLDRRFHPVIDQPVSVGIVTEELIPFDPWPDEVMQRSRCINACFRRHELLYHGP